MLLQNHAWITNPFKVQDRPMDFNVTEYKRFIDMVSNSTLQINIKKLQLVKFRSSTKEQYLQYISLLLLPQEITTNLTTLTQYHLLFHSSIDQNFRWVHLSSLLMVSQSWSQVVGQTGLLSGDSGWRGGNLLASSLRMLEKSRSFKL